MGKRTSLVDLKTAGEITLDAALTDLQWMTNSGVKLEGSEVTVSGNNGSGQCWLEKLTMDEDSRLVLKNVS